MAARGPVRRRRAGEAAYGGGVVLHALLGGEFLQPGSAHEGLVEDERPVLVLTAARGTLGRTFWWFSAACHDFSRLHVTDRGRNASLCFGRMASDRACPS